MKKQSNPRPGSKWALPPCGEACSQATKHSSWCWLAAKKRKEAALVVFVFLSRFFFIDSRPRWSSGHLASTWASSERLAFTCRAWEDGFHLHKPRTPSFLPVQSSSLFHDSGCQEKQFFFGYYCSVTRAGGSDTVGEVGFAILPINRCWKDCCMCF